MKLFVLLFSSILALAACSLSVKDDDPTAGATITTNKTASIEGYVYSHDTSSTRKLGKSALSGQVNVVLLLQLDGKIIKRDTSDSHGHYEFASLDVGIYSIIARFPDGVIAIQAKIGLDLPTDTISVDIHVGPGAYQFISSSSGNPQSSSSISSGQSMVFLDARDGSKYRTIQIGSSKWMAENLNYSTTNGSWCYDNSDSLCQIFGRLYDWQTSQSICPEGWTLPTEHDFLALAQTVGGLEYASYRLKSSSPLWIIPGEDVLGFSVLPGGYSEDGRFANLYGYADFWTSTDFSSSEAKNFHFDYYNASLKHGTYYKKAGLSVRCIQSGDAETKQSSSSPQFGDVFTDVRDGKQYRTVVLGDQEWMAENLNLAESESWCYNDSEEMCSVYGRLYSWESANGVCPEGWHLPTDSEFTGLTDFIGGLDSASYKLKSQSDLWASGSGIDAFGFNVLPAGYYEDGVYSNIRGYADFWTATSANTTESWNRHFDYRNLSLKRGTYTKKAGLSVRCLRPLNPEFSSSSISVAQPSSEQMSSSSLQNGSSSSLAYWNTSISYGELEDARDGSIYRTVMIGSQTWMAQNLNLETNSGSWCYNNKTSMCDLYGRLYYWETAQEICPDGWHLPSDEEFTVLTDHIGGLDSAGYKLKANTSLWWGAYGDDPYGFSVLPSGYYENDGFYNIGGYGDFWTSTNYDEVDAWNRHFDYYNMWLKRGTYHKLSALSVRCLKN